MYYNLGCHISGLGQSRTDLRTVHFVHGRVDRIHKADARSRQPCWLLLHWKGERLPHGSRKHWQGNNFNVQAWKGVSQAGEIKSGLGKLHSPGCSDFTLRLWPYVFWVYLKVIIFYSGQKESLQITSELPIGKKHVCSSHVGWDEDECGLLGERQCPEA